MTAILACRTCGGPRRPRKWFCDTCVSPDAARMRSYVEGGAAKGRHKGNESRAIDRAVATLEPCAHSVAIDAAIKRLEAGAERLRAHVSRTEKYLRDSSAGVVSIHSARRKSRSENIKTEALK